MPDNEYGPFNDEREVLTTRAAAVLRAAFDANPGVGAGDPERLRLLTGACESAATELGEYDLHLLRWLAKYENTTCVQLAGMITRAYQAGLAAQEGTATEWGVRRRGEADPFASGAEGGVRKMAAAGGHLGAPLDVVCRQVTPWVLAPGEGRDDD